MLVQALDGYFYKDVILYGSAGTIDFSSHIGRVAVPCKESSSELAARRKANSLIRELNVTGKLLERSDVGTFIINGVAQHGMAFDFLLLGALEPESLCIRVLEPREHEDCFGFFTDFFVSDLIDWLNGGERLPLLQRALFGEWIRGNDKLVKRRLFAQHSWLRGVRKINDTETKLRVAWYAGRTGDGDNS